MRNCDARPVDIALRIPGRWETTDALGGALPGGFGLERDRLMLPDGSSLAFRPMPADDVFPGVFADACRGRLGPQVQDALSGYTVNACLMGPGGSIDAARRLLDAGAAVVRAAGIGVFVDTGVLAHEGETWMEMRLADDDVFALLAAFVNVVHVDGALASMGMHAFGQRDVLVAVPDAAAAADLLHNFLGYLLLSGGKMADGAVFGTTSAEVVVRAAPPPNHAQRTSPTYNAYGRWRLDPAS